MNAASPKIVIALAVVRDADGLGQEKTLTLHHGAVDAQFVRCDAGGVGLAFGRILAALGHPVLLAGFRHEVDEHEAPAEDAPDEIRLGPDHGSGAPGWKQPVRLTLAEESGDCECCGTYVNVRVVGTAFHPSHVFDLFEDGHLPGSRALAAAATQLWQGFAALNHDAVLEQTTTIRDDGARRS